MTVKLALSWIIFFGIMAILGQRLGRLIYNLALIEVKGPKDLLGIYFIKIYILAVLIYKIATDTFSVSLVNVLFSVVIITPSAMAVYQRLYGCEVD